MTKHDKLKGPKEESSLSIVNTYRCMQESISVGVDACMAKQLI